MVKSKNPYTKQFSEALMKHDIPPKVVDDLINSGYSYIESSLYGLGNPEACVSDTFYGSKLGIGLIPIKEFQDYLYTGEYLPFSVPEYHVRFTETSDCIRKLNVFDHIPPIRPLRQRCALPFFHADSINAAVADLDAIVYISDGFEYAGLPDAEELFPGVDEDPFYRAILEVRNSYQEGPFKDFVEYGQFSHLK
jgi:hypothetical protein